MALKLAAYFLSTLAKQLPFAKNMWDYEQTCSKQADWVADSWKIGLKKLG